MTAPREYAREDEDDVESSRLLGGEHDDDDGRETGDRHAVNNWKDYPAQWWTQAREYAQDWQKRRVDRGKQRQQDARRSPSTSSRQQQQSTLARLRQKHPHVLLALWILLGLIGALIVLIIIVSVHLFAVTLRAPDQATQQRIMERSVNFDGPDNVQVVRFDDEGLTIKIDGRIGVDADSALDEWLGDRTSVSWWKKKDRGILEWAMRKVKGVQIEVDGLALRSPDWTVNRAVEKIDLLPDQKKQDAQMSIVAVAPPKPADLITISIEPLLVPVPAVGLSSKPSGSVSGLPPATTPVNLTVLVKPMGPALLSYAEYTLENKTAYLDVRVADARIRGMNAKDWLRGGVSSSSWWGVPGRVNVHMSDTWKRLAQQLPKIEGNNTNTDEFLNLTRYDFQEIGGPNDDYPERALGLDIYAEAMNPLGKLLRGHVGYSLPFGAYLPVQHANKSSVVQGEDPDMVLLAAVATEPFDIHGEKKVPLRLHGRVIPPPIELLKRDQSPHTAKGKPTPVSNPAADTLSDFLSKFLRGEPNTLYVRGGSPFTQPKINEGSLPMPGGGSDDLPAWLDRLLRTATVPISFPGSAVTDLIQNVSISDLKITPHPFENDKLVCSGIIMGVMNMPGQLATVDVQITDLWPDVLIFNGKPPGMKDPGQTDALTNKKRKKHRKGDGDDDDDTPVPDPLPDPLPEHAFGRVVPRKWAPAETYMDPDDPTGHRKLLRSELKNVPFTVLPGRGAEFRSFSWKVITGEGARAGIDGKAKAKIWNSGLGKLTLSNLPVQGVFTVGKRGSDGGNGDDDGDDGYRTY